MEILKPLREHLKTNPIPSEAQQIDRYLEAFATHVTSDAAGADKVTLNPAEYVQGRDSLYILLFGLIMLNTDMHRVAAMNRAVDAEGRDKPKTSGGWGGYFSTSKAKDTVPKYQHMTLDQFQKQLIGVVSFSKEDLEAIYDDIKATPLF